MNQTQLLTIELVPSTCWGSNVRSEISKKDWDTIRHKVYKAANNRCETCGAPGRLECHERFTYDDENHIQTLLKMVALCRMCHLSQHRGYANVLHKGAEVDAHIAKVNNWSLEDVELYVEAAFELWHRRSSHEWKLDLEVLADYGITPPANPRSLSSVERAFKIGAPSADTSDSQDIG